MADRTFSDFDGDSSYNSRDITRMAKNVKEKRISGGSLSDTERNLINLDKMVKAVQNTQASTAELTNKQSVLMEKYYSEIDEKERARYKRQMRSAQKEYQLQTKFMNDYYKANSKFMDSEEKKRYKDRMANSKKTFKNETKMMSKIYGDAFDSISLDMSKTLKSSIGETFSDIVDQFQRLNLTSKVNQIASGVVDNSSTNVSANRANRTQSGSITKAVQAQMDEYSKEFIKQTNNKLSRSDLVANRSTSYTASGGISNAEDLAQINEQLTLGIALFGEGVTQIDNLGTATRSMNMDLGDNLESWNDFLAKAKDTKGLENIDAEGIYQLLDSVATTVQTVSGGDATKAKDMYDGIVNAAAAAQNSYGSQGTDIISSIMSDLSKGTSSMYTTMGGNLDEFQKIIASGDTSAIFDAYRSRLKGTGVFDDNQYASASAREKYGIDETTANFFKNYDPTRTKSDEALLEEVAKTSSGAAMDAVTSSNDYVEGNVLTKLANQFTDMVGPTVEGFVDAMGISDTDWQGNIAEMLSWIRLIAGKELLGGITSKITDYVKGSSIVNSTKSAYSAGKGGYTAAKAAGSGTLVATSKGIGTGFLKGATSTLGKASLGLGLGLDAISGYMSKDSWGTSGVSSVLGGLVGGSGSGIASNESWWEKLLNIGTNTVKGATAGAIAGTVVPGIGNIAGAIGGGLTGLTTGLIGGENIAKATDWVGGKISDGWNWVKGLFGSEDTAEDALGATDENTKAIQELTKELSGDSSLSWEDRQTLISASNNSHKNGLDTVPYDGYVATLHKDESVLTANQAKMWRDTQRGASSSNFLENAFTNANFTDSSYTLPTSTDGNTTGSSTGTVGTDNLELSGGPLGYLSGGRWSAKEIVDHDLNKTVTGITSTALDNYIKSVGRTPTNYFNGSAAIKASSASGLDARYLLVHAALESGWGTSTLAKAGNLFGIGAFDNNPMNGMNYTGGFVTGAEWIRSHYYDKGNTTLRKMWNNNNPGNYSTTPSQPYTMASMMSTLDGFIKGTGNGATPTYKQGTPWVPDTQLALLHKGEMVVPEEHNPLNSSSSTVPVSSGSDYTEIIQVVQWLGNYLGNIFTSGLSSDGWSNRAVPISNSTSSLRT